MSTAATREPIQSDIVARFRAGDPSALNELVVRFGQELLAYVSSRCPADCSAEDVAQDVWLRVWQAREQFRPESFRGWLYQIAKNRLHDLRKKRRPDLLAESFDPAAPEFDDDDPELDALRDCLQNLSSSFTDVIRRQLQGASTKVMADEFGISEGTVASRVSRGKQQLKECVERKMQ